MCGCGVDSWSGSHIRWGQPFRLRHLTTGHYLALTEDRGLVLQDRERSDTVATAFCFRASKVRTHAHTQHMHTEMICIIQDQPHPFPFKHQQEGFMKDHLLTFYE